ncbi:metabolite traffic protein EboE [Chondrinema litorale]|uniref:metabolite traffic protein EboE n=1 Tax=Chondrinema litorale TaxID=2994555 RepID=UPI0025429055|nr:metabolite traffic protein EboE [Chondrinema litorale]UZR94176.1 metabolite traffic protein EboE [Chondrinema litorale]
MKLNNTPFQLTYCTNIHPGEDWEETFTQLQSHLPAVKKQFSPNDPFGVGLRLSDKASKELLEGNHFEEFKSWLTENDLYVFTMNGFPYGSFHRTVVKDDVHTPDWTTKDRLNYTTRLFNILNELLPADLKEGGISTSPLSYKYWHKSLDKVYEEATLNYAKIALHLYNIKKQTGKSMHLDLEPEPDGVLENTPEVIAYFDNWLIPKGSEFLAKELGLPKQECEEIIREHIQLCYDVCHYAIAFEEPAEVFAAMEKAKIKIGKIQISAALKAAFTKDTTANKEVLDVLKNFEESTYLHQVIEQNNQNELVQYRDLNKALENYKEGEEKEWRIHFHVPLFSDDYDLLKSTRSEIEKTLKFVQEKQGVNHLEIETYTWEVLPERFQKDIDESIVRELEWVKSQF